MHAGQLPTGAHRRLRHLPALDGLRGVAVAGVLAFHAGHLSGGYLGVDLFFVLSGYLITSLLVLEWAATGSVSLSAFWARRARRLLPALFAVLIAVGVASRWLVPPVSRGQIREEAVATLAYVANWFSIFRGNGYWEQTLLPSWLEHTWSLAIEEQFYLVWPLVVVAVWTIWQHHGDAAPRSEEAVRRGVRRLAAVAVGAAAASAALMVVLAFGGASRERLYLGTDTRAAAILLGAGLACLQYLAGERTMAPLRRRAVGVAGLAGAVVLAVAWARLSGTGDALYRGGFLVCGLAAALVLLDCTTAGPSPLQRALALRPLRWLGIISYGLYLWHWPIYQYLRTASFAPSGWALVALQVAASVLAAAVSYHFLELPIRRGALRGGAARVAALATAGAAVAVVVVGTMGAIDPVPQAAGEQAGGAAGPDDGPRLMVIGDSAAYTLAIEGLLPEADRLGVRVINAALVGCTIMRDVDDPLTEAIRNCSPEWQGAVRRHRPDIVVVLFGGWMGVIPAPVDGEDVWPCEAAWQERWRDRLDEAVTTLSGTGADVVLLSAPTARDPVFKGEDPELFDARQRCSNRGIDEVARARPEASFVDLGRFVCPADDRCRSRLDGAELRPDALHFSGDGAVAVARWLVPEVVAAARGTTDP